MQRDWNMSHLKRNEPTPLKKFELLNLFLSQIFLKKEDFSSTLKQLYPHDEQILGKKLSENIV